MCSLRGWRRRNRVVANSQARQSSVFDFLHFVAVYHVPAVTRPVIRLVRVRSLLCTCSFFYRVGTSPQVIATDREVYPGALLRVYGTQVGAVPSDIDVRVGGTSCPVNAASTPDGVYVVASPYVPYTIACTVKAASAGRYNVSMGSSVGAGLVSSPVTVYPTDASATPAMTTLRPVITSATSNAGGNLGGYSVTIFGAGFSNAAANNVVSAGDAGHPILAVETCSCARPRCYRCGCLCGGVHLGGRVHLGGGGQPTVPVIDKPVCVCLCVCVRVCVCLQQVLLDSVPCAVQSSDMYSITCIPGANPSGSSPAHVTRPGPAGVVIDGYHNVTANAGFVAAFASTPAYPLHPNTTTVSTGGGVSANGGVQMQLVPFPDGYLERTTGLFVAPLTTNYTFYVMSEFNSELFLGSGAGRDNVSRICAITYYSTR